jgi:peptide/nickel transport system ATP-binding protein
VHEQASAVLSVRNLKTYFRTPQGVARAVDGVSFDVAPGETLALVGESGCGKSVTALSVMQLVAEPAGYHAGGEIWVGDTEMTSLPANRKREIRGSRVAMIFQDPMTSLNPTFTVGFQIVEAIRRHSDATKPAARAEAIELLRRVRIPDPEQRLDEYPHQLSGGMKQRVMIAMALSCRPDVLIADEPTTALDVTVQAQILDIITELQADMGMAVVLITHDLGVVRGHADTVAVMYTGRIVERAPTEELFANPSHPYTQALLRSLPSRQKRGAALDTIDGRVPAATDFPDGCRFAERCAHAMDVCREQYPAPHQIDDTHVADCHLYALEMPAEMSATSAQPKVSAEAAAEAAAHEAHVSDHVVAAVRDLRVHFPIRKGVLRRTVGHVRAVDGVSLDVRAGETVAVVGESGCGKTTLGKGALRLIPATGGDVEIAGVRVSDLRAGDLNRARGDMQMVFQDPYSSLDPRMMVGEIVEEGMLAQGRGGATRAERTARIRDVMEQVGLDPAMMERYPHEFSGGQRQRIAIARALAVEPKFIVFDEPTSALDISVQAAILNLLRELQRDLGLAYLFITHDLSVVEYIADQVAVMYLGRIVEHGPAADLLANPRHPYTRALLSAVPKVDDTGAAKIRLEGDVPSPVNPPNGCHFHPRCPEVFEPCAEAYPELVAVGGVRCACFLHVDSAEA